MQVNVVGTLMFMAALGVVLVAEFGLEDRVVFSGRVSGEELVRLYNRSELVVSPSLYEGFGLPAADAMACGVPVVATTAGGRPATPCGACRQVILDLCGDIEVLTATVDGLVCRWTAAALLPAAFSAADLPGIDT